MRGSHSYDSAFTSGFAQQVGPPLLPLMWFQCGAQLPIQPRDSKAHVYPRCPARELSVKVTLSSLNLANGQTPMLSPPSKSFALFPTPSSRLHHRNNR
ncbi:hypothetical protein ACOSQ2_025732 [Xanthoceras sorbifolium]